MRFYNFLQQKSKPLDCPNLWLLLLSTNQKIRNTFKRFTIFLSVYFLLFYKKWVRMSLCCCRIGPQVQWYSQSLAGTSMIPVVSSPDLLLVRYAPTLPICAVVINQLSTRDRCVLFVSPQHHYQVAANLKCLRDSPVSGRRWVTQGCLQNNIQGNWFYKSGVTRAIDIKMKISFKLLEILLFC